MAKKLTFPFEQVQKEVLQLSNNHHFVHETSTEDQGNDLRHLLRLFGVKCFHKRRPALQIKKNCALNETEIAPLMSKEALH